MAIQISGSTIIDNSRNIVDAGIATANYFDGFFPGGDKVYNENTTVDNGKTNIVLESDIIVNSGDTLTVSTGSTIVLNPFDFEKSSVDELLVDKKLVVGVSSAFDVVSSGIGSVGPTSTTLTGSGIDTTNNVSLGLLVKPIPGIIGAGTTITGIGANSVTINPASLNTTVQEDITFKFGFYGEKKSNIIIDGENGVIVNSSGTPILNQTGSVLQVVHETMQDGVDRGTSSTIFSDTGLSATITPTSDSSKILVMTSMYFDISRNSGSSFGGFRVLRNDLVVWSNSQSAPSTLPYGIGIRAVGATAVSSIGQYDIKFVDSPVTKSPLNYKIQFAVDSGTNSENLFVSYNAGPEAAPDPRSDIILMEIAS